MRFIMAIATAAFVLSSASITSAQTPKESPRVEQQEKMKSQGNTENQNQNDSKAKEQAPMNTTTPNSNAMPSGPKSSN